MAVLDDDTKGQVKEMLLKMKDEVNLVYVDKDSPLNKQIKELLGDLVELSDKIKLTVYNADDKEAKVLGLENAPAVVMMSKNIKGKIIYYGITITALP